MKVYAFDVDDTLEVSKGPVKLADVLELRGKGHIVGICGNWPVLVRTRKDWHRFVSFLTPIPGEPKTKYLKTLKQHIPAEEYVFVGNVDRGHNDKQSADNAGWRFVKEDDFGRGIR